MSKKVLIKDVPVGTQVCIANGGGTVFIVFHKSDDLVQCVETTPSLADQKLVEIPSSSEVNVIPHNNNQSKKVFVRDLKDHDCVHLPFIFSTPTVKVSDTAQGYILPEGKHSFQITSKTESGLDVDFLKQLYCVHSNDSRLFCQLHAWNYVFRDDFFFHENELRFHGNHYADDAFSLAKEVIDQTLWTNNDATIANVIRKQLAIIDLDENSDENSMKDRRKNAKILLLMVQSLVDKGYEKQISFVKGCLEDSVIGRDILKFATKGI